MKNKAIIFTLALIPSTLSALPPVETVYLNNGNVYFGYLKELDTNTNKVTFEAEQGIYQLTRSDYDKLKENSSDPIKKAKDETGEFVEFFKNAPKVYATIGSPQELEVYDLEGESEKKWGRHVILANESADGATIISLKPYSHVFDYNQMDSITREPLIPEPPYGLRDQIWSGNSTKPFTGINTLTIPRESFKIVTTENTTVSLDNMVKKGKICIDSIHDYIYNSPLITEIEYYKEDGKPDRIKGVLVMEDYKAGTKEIYPKDGTKKVVIASKDIKRKVSERNPDFGKERPKTAAPVKSAPVEGEKNRIAEPAEQPKPEAQAVSKKGYLLDGTKVNILKFTVLNDINDKEGWSGSWTLNDKDLKTANKVELTPLRIIAFEFRSPEPSVIDIYKLEKDEESGKIQFKNNDLVHNTASVKKMVVQNYDSEDFGATRSAVVLKNVQPDSYYLIHNLDTDKFYLIYTFSEI